jgi:hypothetical protein
MAPKIGKRTSGKAGGDEKKKNKVTTLQGK